MRHLIFFTLLCAFCLGSNEASAQNITASHVVDSIYYKGQAIYKKNKLPFESAMVIFYDIDKDYDSINLSPKTPHVDTDENGEFCIKLPTKDYNIRMMFLDLIPKTVQAVIPMENDKRKLRKKLQHFPDSTIYNLGRIILEPYTEKYFRRSERKEK